MISRIRLCINKVMKVKGDGRMLIWQVDQNHENKTASKPYWTIFSSVIRVLSLRLFTFTLQTCREMLREDEFWFTVVHWDTSSFYFRDFALKLGKKIQDITTRHNSKWRNCTKVLYDSSRYNHRWISFLVYHTKNTIGQWQYTLTPIFLISLIQK